MSTEFATSPNFSGSYKFGGYANVSAMNMQTFAGYRTSSGTYSKMIPSNETWVIWKISITRNSTRGYANQPDNFPYFTGSVGIDTPYADMEIQDGFNNLIVKYGTSSGVGGDQIVLNDRKTPLVMTEFTYMQITSNWSNFYVNYSFQRLQ